MTDDPISIDEARARVLAQVHPRGAERVAVGDALGRVLARELRAAGDVPPFANSAMDGYATLPGPGGRRLRVAGESRAGRPSTATLGEGEAIRISTGAAVPPGPVGVVPVERARVEGDAVELAVAVATGDHVRPPGEDVRAGTVVLAAGTALGAAELGVAVSAGVGHLDCARRPLLVLLATGDELRPPGAALAPGQIHNTNAIALRALALGAGGRVLEAGVVADDRAATDEALASALDEADVVVVSGGVSVGPHDHVKAALRELGVRERFWGVALKPGKPTWFGTMEDRLVFGLPGNPVSSMVTFCLFVHPALRALQGAPGEPERVTALLAEDVRRAPGREQAVRVRLQDRDGARHAVPTGPQGSHILTSMIGARGLALVPAGEGVLAAGSPVAVEPLGAMPA